MAKEVVFCAACDIPTNQPEVHHIKPQRCGGSDDDDNLVTICRTCHDFVDRVPLAQTFGWIFEKMAREPAPRWAMLIIWKLLAINFDHAKAQT